MTEPDVTSTPVAPAAVERDETLEAAPAHRLAHRRHHPDAHLPADADVVLEGKALGALDFADYLRKNAAWLAADAAP